MPKLGTAKTPAVVRVQTVERAVEITTICEKRGWYVRVTVDPDEPEDIMDIVRLLGLPVNRGSEEATDGD